MTWSYATSHFFHYGGRHSLYSFIISFLWLCSLIKNRSKGKDPLYSYVHRDVRTINHFMLVASGTSLVRLSECGVYYLTVKETSLTGTECYWCMYIYRYTKFHQFIQCWHLRPDWPIYCFHRILFTKSNTKWIPLIHSFFFFGRCKTMIHPLNIKRGSSIPLHPDALTRPENWEGECDPLLAVGPTTSNIHLPRSGGMSFTARV